MKNKFKILITLVAVLICSVMALFITACNVGGNKNGNVPVYRGMSISKTASARATKTEIALQSGTVSPDYSGDYSGRDDNINKNNPFDGNSDSIEEVIESTLHVTGSVKSIYYAVPNEDVYITIHIDNPDNFEILSFTLNNTKYSSYMFEYGSDMENLILKVNVGNVSGIVEYTIDQIKYVDGTEIKDVAIGGDQTVRAGVRTANQVNAQVTESKGFNDIELNITVNDNDGLVKYSSGKLAVVLYDGETLIDEADLKVGSNTVKFDGLKTGGLYQYAVIGYYDSLINGFTMNVLYKNALYTENIVLFNNINVTKDGVSFGYVWHKNSTVNEISSLSLLKNGKTTALNASATSVNGLLSNNDYTLAAKYINNGNEEEIKLDFHTLTKVIPNFSVTTNNVTTTGFGFNVAVTDTDSVGSITKIERIHNGQATTADLTARTFDNLLSNNDYTVRVTYTYDLNDGTGEHTIVKEATATTLAKATPNIEVATSNSTQTGFDFAVTVTDTDGVGSITKIERVHGNTSTNAELAARTFDNLLSNNEYTVRVTYTYDLNDGTGTHTIVKEATATTLAKATPDFSITTNNVTTAGFDFNITVTDEDEVGNITKIELLSGGKVQKQVEPSARTFSELISYTTYTVSVTYTYNLNDGAGEHTITKMADTKTLGADHSIIYHLNEGVNSAQNPETFNEANTTTLAKATRDYYTFWGWYTDELLTNVLTTIPENTRSDVHLYAKWVYGTEGLKYGLSNGTYSVTGYTGTDTKVAIPEEWNGYPVTTINGNAFKNYTTITDVIIGNNITSIGNSAFSGCTSLETVYWNATNCTSAGSFSGSYSNLIFSGCTALTTVIIGNNVQIIPAYAFTHCTAEIIWGNNTRVTEIGYCAFYYYKGTSITIPDSVTSIGDRAFIGCSSLTSITIPDSVTSIGDRAFDSCTSLTSVVIGNKVTSIGSSAFSYCESLTSVTIGNSVTSIGSLAFVDCYKLVEVWNYSSLNIEKGNYSYGYVAYYALAVYKGDEKSKVTTVDGYVFYEDNDSSYLVGYMGKETNLSLPQKSPKGNSYAIYKNAFYNCASLTSVSIGNGVTTIGDRAFIGCSSLTSITIPDSVTSIGDSAFIGCSTSLESIKVGNGNIKYKSEGNCIIDMTTNTLILGCKNSVIPDSVTSIGDHAFNGCSSLTSITIPDSVTSIGSFAFAYCTSLTSVVIGNKVTSIGSSAFSYCESLTSITIPDSVTSIDHSAFEGCRKLTSVTFENISGWTAYFGGSDASVPIASGYLASPQMAAQYLTDTYCGYAWGRN